MDPNDRLTELELKFMEQSHLLDQLNEQLVVANEALDLAKARITRLEVTVQQLMSTVDVPLANEKPPHY